MGDRSALEIASETLVDAISFDDNGALIGGRWMGGHGGLLSEDTRKKADAVRRELSRLQSAREADRG